MTIPARPFVPPAEGKKDGRQAPSASGTRAGATGAGGAERVGSGRVGSDPGGGGRGGRSSRE